MKYYLKQALFPIIYLLFMLMIALGIVSINDSLTWLKVILCLLNIAFYGFIVGAVAFKEGEESIKVQHANDLERMVIVKTGEDRPLKLREEYKPYKGFLIGLISSFPLIILMLLHTVLVICGADNMIFGNITAIIYFAFFALFRLDSSLAITKFTYYYSLFYLPFIVVLFGVCYLLGARKMIIQNEKIQEKQRMIYGDKK